MKRGILFLFVTYVLFLFLSTQTLVLGVQVIKEGWVENDKEFIIGQNLFRVYLVSDNQLGSLIFYHNGKRFFVDLHDCRVRDDVEYCYNSYSYDQKVTVHSGRIFPGLHITINDLRDKETPQTIDLRLSSTATGDKFLYREHKALLTIENRGNSFADGSRLVINVPPQINIVDRGDFSLFGNQLTKTFNLQPNQHINLTFNYKVLDASNQRFDYEFFRKDANIGKSSFTVKGEMPIEISITHPNNPDIMQLNTVGFSVRNKDPFNELEIVELILSGPRSFQYVNPQGLRQNFHGLFFSTSNHVDKASTRDYSVRFRPILTGDYSFQVNGLFVLDGLEYEAEASATLKVVNEGLNPSVSFSRRTIAPDSNTILTIRLNNDHKRLFYRDIKVEVVSEIFNATKSYDSIRPGETLEVINERLSIPFVNESRDFAIDISVSFLNEGGQKEEIKLTDSFKVLVNEGFSITQRINPRNGEAGDEIAVEIHVRSFLDGSFAGVQITDHLPSGVSITGRNSVQTEFSPNENKQVYAYFLKIPERPTSNTLPVVTSLKVPGINLELNETSYITVHGEIFEAETKQEQEIIETHEEYNGLIEHESDEVISPEEDEELNFLARIFRGIGNFFSRIFG